MKVYVLVDEHGEYSDYTKSIERVYASREAAEHEAARLNALCNLRKAANNVLYRQEYNVFWPEVKAEYDDCAIKLSRLQKQQTWAELYKNQEWIALNNRRGELNDRVKKQIVEFSRATYPQFQDQPDEVSQGYFKTDQDYCVEEHDFVEGT